MKTKNIKVVYSNRYANGSVPKIQMEGKWLEALGFSIGTPLVLEYAEGSITVRLRTAEETAAEKQKELDRRKAAIKKEQLALLAEYEQLSKVAEQAPSYRA